MVVSLDSPPCCQGRIRFLVQVTHLTSIWTIIVEVCVGNSQFAPSREPSEFANSHPDSQRAVQTCEIGALQRSAALAGGFAPIPIRNHL